MNGNENRYENRNGLLGLDEVRGDLYCGLGEILNPIDV